MDIVARAKGLIARPWEEWQTIAGEPSETAGLFKGYVAPVSAVPAVAGFVGVALFARMFAGALPGFSLGAVLVQSVVSCVLGLAGVWGFGKITKAPAPRFGGTGEEVAAMKLAADPPTAMWLAGAVALVPSLGVFVLLGLYSLCILYKGVPAVARVPENRAMASTLTLVARAVALNPFIVLVSAPLFAG